MEYENKILQKCIEALESKKALDINVYDVGDRSAMSDYIVVCTGTSSTHVNALGDKVHEDLKDTGVLADHIEKDKSGLWILLDYGSVIVHIFSREARDFYALEDLIEKNNDKK